MTLSSLIDYEHFKVDAEFNSEASVTTFKTTLVINRSQDSSVGIATGHGWMAGVRFPAGQDFLFSTASKRTPVPTKPPTQ
jgi:hypothetical protein